MPPIRFAQLDDKLAELMGNQPAVSPAGRDAVWDDRILAGVRGRVQAQPAAAPAPNEIHDVRMRWTRCA